MPLKYELPGLNKKSKKALGKYLFAFFSQHCEDVVLSTAIQKGQLPQVGFYVDLGAFHPLKFSNTAMLNILGWRGVNVDANPEVITLFNGFRPNDINVCAGISDQQETLKYHRFTQNGINTFSEEHARRMIENGNVLEQIIEVECYSVNTILGTHVPEGQHIDVLNIDLEGFDEQIIRAIDWDKYKPTVVLTEAFVEDIEEYVTSDIHKFLVQLGYRLFSKMGLTAIYLRKN